MGELSRTQGEGTLRTPWGFPYGAWRQLPGADIALAAAVSASFVMGLVGVGAAVAGSADGGFVTDGVGTRLSVVRPTGFVWSDGVRAGDLVLSLRASDEPGGWEMTVQTGLGTVTTSAAPRDESLRATTPVAIAGLLISGAGFALRSRWPRSAWAAASIGLALSSTSLAVQGDAMWSTVGLGAALALPAAALIGARLRSVVGLALAAVLSTFLVVWAISRTFAIGDPTSLEELRSTVAFVLVLGVILTAAIEIRRTGTVARRRATSTFELAGAAAFLGVLIVIALFVHVDVAILAVIALVAFLAYPRTRRAILRAADSLVLGDVRRQAAMEASEGERARLAADLHDVPIQELSAVIARLELVPDAVEERAALRRIAAQLRAVTTELRPPVLDDLGLPMAIESLADQYARDGTAIRVDVDDRTSPEQARDPDVELAIYRVTEEAVRNAMTHADARRVDVLGVIGPDVMEIEVRDDGRGLDGRALEVARKAGHAGLIAMRQRADAIGARLSLRSEIGVGVSVIVAWHR
ncbi:MAG TPA: histidine kinase [Candidatus Limnocylindrales bacterium]|nr:histidine kinase [Candidatus Limnocylindrales bacterium]